MANIITPIEWIPLADIATPTPEGSYFYHTRNGKFGVVTKTVIDEWFLNKYGVIHIAKTPKLQ